MKQFKNILYVAEAGGAEARAMARAVALAENNQADLTVIGVVPAVKAGIGVPPGGVGAVDLQSALVNARRQELDSLVAPYRKRGNIQVEVLVGQPFFAAIRTVLRNQHDLLLKAAENPAFIERLFGSNDMHLLRKCPCPVWLTGSEEKPNHASIVAAVDFSVDDTSNEAEQGLNQQILHLASSLALSEFATLHVVHVWDAPGEAMVRSWSNNPDQAAMNYLEGERLLHEKGFNRLRDQLMGQIGREAYDHLSPQFHLRRGTAATAIPEIAVQLQADLVVMGTVARTGIPGLIIGNTAETILEQLHCSVLAVKPPGFVSPVTPSA